MLSDDIQKQADALENLVIAIGMGWDLEGVLEVAKNAMEQRTAILERVRVMEEGIPKQRERGDEYFNKAREYGMRLQELKAEQAEAYGYASRLFKLLAPQCEPLDTTAGVLTQLDNYIAGLNQAELTEDGKFNVLPPLVRAQHNYIKELQAYISGLKEGGGE